MSKILSRRDLDFLLYEWLDVEALTARERFADHSRETFDAFLDVSAQIAERDFAPHNRRSDLEEPTFDGVRVQVIPEVAAALLADQVAGRVVEGEHRVGGAAVAHLVVEPGRGDAVALAEPDEPEPRPVRPPPGAPAASGTGR